MRRWAADKLRLALRKVMPRLMAFAFFPTKKEFDVIVTQACSRWVEGLFSETSKPEDRQRLH